MSGCLSLLPLRSGSIIYVQADGLLLNDSFFPLPNVISLAEVSGPSRVAVATKDSKIVNLLSLDPFEVVESLVGDVEPILHVAANNQVMVVVSSARVRFFDVVGQVLVHTFLLPAGPPVALAMADVGGTSLFLAEQRAVFSLSPEAGRAELAVFDADILAIATADKRTLLVLLADNRVAELDLQTRRLSTFLAHVPLQTLVTAGAVQAAASGGGMRLPHVWPIAWLRSCAAGDVAAVAALAPQCSRRITRKRAAELLRERPQDALQLAVQLSRDNRLVGIADLLHTFSDRVVRTGDWRAEEKERGAYEDEFERKAKLLAAVAALHGKLDLLGATRSGGRPAAAAAAAAVDKLALDREETVRTDEEPEN